MPTETAKPKPRGKKAVPPSTGEQVAPDVARSEALAREHGADLSEDGFDEAPRKVGRRAADAETPESFDDERR